ncbi:MAG: isochorismatase family protein [Holophagales bacterium]|nr:isochorismatase family protein [Holophagales bacterium]MYD22373.1 isochorismatase family protein [Holophagales bacterium]MYI33033.1 isochorismatase family protein [Holophagales bacterium]
MTAVPTSVGNRAAGDTAAIATLDRERAIVLVIDLQGRLVDLMDRSRMLLDGTARLLRLAQLFDLPVIVTEQYPQGLGSTREEVEAAILQTDPDGSRTWRVEKDSFGCCGVPAFEEALDAARPGLPAPDRQVVVAGIEAHICVVQTVLDLMARGTDVHVCWDCVSSRGEEYRRHALERMGNAGAQITNHESVAFELARDKNHPQFRGVNRLLREGQIA